MCSQFEVNCHITDIKVRFQKKNVPHVLINKVVRPTDKVTVITPAKSSVTKIWGISTSWSKNPIINARAETVIQKPTFAPLINNRCLIPVTAYFEWQVSNLGKHKCRIAHNLNKIISFAGLFYKDAFVILTCKPESSMGQIHSRMPVILAEDHEDYWLNPDNSFELIKLQPIAIDESELVAKKTITPKAQHELFL